ncbi:DUF1702 family protein [Dactylosporangium sp. NPDC049140]|uniref:DUF1702 family protein n=1 Tax=Dactylosporangium sp. NPDC049140 TaxID=3155647 RepID=UPI00340527CF
MSYWRSLRRRVLTPNVSETKLEVRGFHVKSPEARHRLETVGESFLRGYALAAEAGRPLDAETGLERVDAEFRGFAYEGAAMGYAVRDGLPLGRRDHVEQFLRGRADRHVYMAYVGVGWAMARVPKLRWSTLHMPDPLLRWLVLDGYGFHQAYFRTRRYVYEQYRDDRFTWPGGGPGDYANRVVDQGVGRATWFVAGTEPRRVVELFAKFAPHRRADLYSGAGLAATYAGGADAAELEWFRDAAGAHAADIAQGSAFAAAARLRADLLVPHNEVATKVFCGMSPAEAARVTDETRVQLPGRADIADYEVWRQRIRDAFVPVGR